MNYILFIFLFFLIKYTNYLFEGNFMQNNTIDIISIFISILSLIFSASSLFIVVRININSIKVDQKKSKVTGDQIGRDKNVIK